MVAERMPPPERAIPNQFSPCSSFWRPRLVRRVRTGLFFGGDDLGELERAFFHDPGCFSIGNFGLKVELRPNHLFIARRIGNMYFGVETGRFSTKLIHIFGRQNQAFIKFNFYQMKYLAIIVLFTALFFFPKTNFAQPKKYSEGLSKFEVRPRHKRRWKLAQKAQSEGDIESAIKLADFAADLAISLS